MRRERPDESAASGRRRRKTTRHSSTCQTRRRKVQSPDRVRLQQVILAMAKADRMHLRPVRRCRPPPPPPTTPWWMAPATWPSTAQSMNPAGKIPIVGKSLFKTVEIKFMSAKPAANPSGAAGCHRRLYQTPAVVQPAPLQPLAVQGGLAVNLTLLMEHTKLYFQPA